MNNSPVADALRFAVTQTVRALTQPGGIQAVAADLQHQTQARPANLAPNTQQTLTAHANAGASASVELSPAALMPPVEAARQLAATRGAVATPLTVAMLELPQRLAASRPGEAIHATDALRLAAQLKSEAEMLHLAEQPIATMLRSVSSHNAMANYAAMQPALARKREDTRPSTARLGTAQDARVETSAAAWLLGTREAPTGTEARALGPASPSNNPATAAAANPTAREVRRGAALPRQERAVWRRAWEPLILRWADVHERGEIEAEVDRRRDDEIVGAIREVAEEQDDDERPEEGAYPGPAPAGSIEQTKQDATRRTCPELLRWSRTAHRYFTTSVPTMFGCTVQTKT